MNDPRSILTDAAYVTIGFGVVAFQQAAVQRREIQQRYEDTYKLVGERVTATVTELRRRFPEQAVAEAVTTAVGAAKDAAAQVLDVVRPPKKAAA